MKVAYLVNQYPKVSHTFIRREIEALERQGVPVLRFALRGRDGALVDAADAAERERTEYVLAAGALALAGATLAAALRAPARFAAALAGALRLARGGDRPLLVHLIYLAEACLLARWLRAAGATHLHAHFGTNAAAVAMLVRLLGGPPCSFTVHGPEEFDRPAALRLALKASHASFVAAVSSFGRSQLYRWLDASDWSRVRVVPCGLGQDFAGAPRTAPPEAARLVCVGRLCEQKGQLLLVEAAARLAARGVAFELVLAGDGELRAALEGAIAAHGLGARVRITGQLDGAAVRAELAAARALVLPSFAEGLPVVIMEAMALRRPVISTYVAGIPELVVPGQTGWLVPAGAVDELAEAMQQCLAASPVDLERMGAQGRARVLRRHDIDAAATRLAGLFAAAATDAAGAARPARPASAVEAP